MARRSKKNTTHALVAAARRYVGRESRYHQAFAGNCIENPGDRCFDGGLGPDVFDCSGFILRAICDVTGQDVHEFAGVRHVRDMWRAAKEGNHPMFSVDDLAVGNLVVTRRIYDIGGREVEIPGHVGILTDVSMDPPRFIHAPTFNKEGQVEERQILTTATIIGAIAVDLSQSTVRMVGDTTSVLASTGPGVAQV